MTGLLSRVEPAAGFYRVAFSSLAAGVLALGLAAPALAQDTPDELPEHPVIKPMNDATLLEDSSRADDFGQMPVRYRLDGKTIDETAEGRFWHLEYQLENRDTSRDEIMANYAAELERVGGRGPRQERNASAFSHREPRRRHDLGHPGHSFERRV